MSTTPKGKPRFKVTMKDRKTGETMIFEVAEKDIHFEAKNRAYYYPEAGADLKDNPIVRAEITMVQPKVRIKNGK